VRAATLVVAILSVTVAPGCRTFCAIFCGEPPPSPPGLTRDTPEEALDFIRAAFASDNLRDQFESLHEAFTGRQGITYTKLALAHDARPGAFAKMTRYLAEARIESVERSDSFATAAGPRRAARVTLSVPGGGRGVFIVVDEPRYLLVTGDGEVPRKTGILGGQEAGVRVRDGQLEASLRVPLGRSAPADGAEVRRLEIHGDWLLYDIESLEGFDEFLGEVKEASEASSGGGPGR